MVTQLIDLDIRAKYGLNIVAIKRGRRNYRLPSEHRKHSAKDILIVIGHDDE